LNGFYDILIPGAAAKVSFKGFSYFFFAGSAIILKKVRSRHDNTRRTEATLQAMTLIKAFL
jgi:hypothetical protein